MSHVLPYNHDVDDEVELTRDSSFTETDTPHRRHTRKRQLWLVGFVLFIVANVFGSFVQLTTLPLIILSPLQSIGLIFNSIFSCLLLPGEYFTRKLGFGTALIAVGACVIAYNGTGAAVLAPDVGADERFRLVIERFVRPGFLVWWISTLVLLLVLVRINLGLGRQVRSQCVLKGARRLNRRAPSASRLVFTQGILYGVVSGTLTAHTFLFAKSIVDVMVETLLSHGKPKSLATYVTVVVLLCATLVIVGLQLLAFNLGLSHILTSILYPLCFFVYNLVNLINDLTFNQLLSTGLMTPKQLWLVVLGLLDVLVGVLMISWDSAFSKSHLEGSHALMTAKFPYELLSTRMASFEETELLSQLCEE